MTTMRSMPGVLVLLAAASAALAAGEAHHWGYGGAHGPAAWGEEHGAEACGVGKQQSPIDIRGAKTAALPALGFGYRKSAGDVVNNGHTIQVNLADGGTLDVGGAQYRLVQFHFHTPSEERIDGKGAPMVAHLVHQGPDGKLAVVAVLLGEGKANGGVARVFDAMPHAAGGRKALAAPFDAADLLPADRGYYHYVGSLTTPPCSEGVQWQVLKQPGHVSKAQIAAFRKLYPMNARPVQPVNDRVVEQS